MSATRPYALVLYGATGFTGGLCARYLARKLPAGELEGPNRERTASAVTAGIIRARQGRGRTHAAGP